MEILKIAESEEKKVMKKMLLLNTLAARGDPKDIEKMLR